MQMPPARRLRFLATATAVVALIFAASCFSDPQKQLDQMQQMTDLGDALNQLGQQTAELQFTIDSLRAIVAKQDTAIYRMANVTGVPYVRTP
jgi:septal ring factor EnvC (AmiA/AmiB activator)